MLKQHKRTNDEFDDAFDAAGQLKPGVTRVRVPIRMMDAASVPTKAVSEAGFIRAKDSTKRDNTQRQSLYDQYDLSLAGRWRTVDAEPCQNCAAPNSNDANFCSNCGTQFPPVSDDDNGADDAADLTLANPPGSIASKVSDHASRMEKLYQARDVELANAYRSPAR
jgi:hypothetical protein